MHRWLQRGLLFAVLALCVVPARAAEPMLMFLFSIAREVVSRSITEQLNTQAFERVEPAEVYPGTQVQPEHLRRLIDGSFNYLSEPQRVEVFDALHRELLHPRNNAVRGAMIEFFVHRALQVRAAQVRLAQLSAREMESLAVEFRDHTRALPDDEREQLRTALVRRLLPVPNTLNDMLLAAVSPGIAAEPSGPAGSSVPAPAITQ